MNEEKQLRMFDNLEASQSLVDFLSADFFLFYLSLFIIKCASCCCWVKSISRREPTKANKLKSVRIIDSLSIHIIDKRILSIIMNTCQILSGHTPK
jgi:hypothetical protein